MQIKDIAFCVDQCADQRGVGKQFAFGQLAQRRLHRWFHPVGGVARDRHRSIHGRWQAGVSAGVRRLVFAAVKFGLGIKRGEETARLASALRIAEEKRAAGTEGVVEKKDQLPLQLRREVDEQVAAAKQVELGERRIFNRVLLGEHEHIAEVFVHAENAGVALGREEAGQALRGDVGGNGCRINPRAGHRDGAAVDVRGEYLHGIAAVQRFHLFGQKHGDRVSLLAGRATRHPDAHREALGMFLEKPRDDLMLEGGKSVRIAEEPRYIDEQIVEERLDFFGVF